jgi:hypothetical protein
MAAQSHKTGTADALRTYEDTIVAKIHEANGRIDRFEAKAKVKRARAEIMAINGLKTARENAERMLRDLKTTRDAQVERAKTNIDGAIVALEESLEDFRRKFVVSSEKE